VTRQTVLNKFQIFSDEDFYYFDEEISAPKWDEVEKRTRKEASERKR
jgi:hypothetical protein